jgi:hypothetical protein
MLNDYGSPRRIQTLKLSAAMPAASDRVLVLDTPRVLPSKHWLVAKFGAKAFFAYAAPLSVDLQLILCEPETVTFSEFNPPPLPSLGDTATTWDFPARPLVLDADIDPVHIVGAGTFAMAATTIGGDPRELIVRPRGFLRAILNSLVAGAGAVPPFPPPNARLDLFVQFIEEEQEPC